MDNLTCLVLQSTEQSVNQTFQNRIIVQKNLKSPIITYLADMK